MSVIIKATYGAVTRRLPFSEPQTLDSLRTQLCTHFTIPAEARLTYKDEDGDDITFSTDAELVEQLAAAAITPNKVLRITIVSETDVPAPVPQLDTLVANISELVTTMRGRPVPPAKRVCRRGLDIEPDQPKRPRIFAGIRPLFAAFPSRQGLRANIKAIDQETRTSFKQTVSAIKKSKQRKQLVTGLKTATPAFRELITDLPDEGLPTVERVQVFVDAVEASVTGIDDAVVLKITAFINQAASDPALVDCLRKIKDAPLMPWESGFVKNAATSRGFQTHQITCGGCEKSPIVGVRFESPMDGFNLCAECHENSELGQGRNFVARKYTWEKNYEGQTVPPAPMKIGDRGNKVKFLHKLLTDLGFMNSSMYNRRPGLFSDSTEKAVSAFQTANNIAGEAGVYDEPTANRLEQSIREREVRDAPEGSTMQPATEIGMKA